MPIDYSGLVDGPPDLSAIEEAKGLPKGLLKGVHMTESSGNYNAINPDSGARGGFQFLPDTAKRYKVNFDDPHSQAEGAGNYLSDLIQRNGGDYKKALAQYGGFKTKDPSNYIAKIEKYMPKEEPVASIDYSGLTTPTEASGKIDYSAVDNGDEKPWFTGDPTAGIMNAIKHSGQAIGDSPGVGSAGVGYGLTGGMGSFLLSLTDLPVSMVKGLANGHSLEEIKKSHDEFSHGVSERMKQAFVMLASIPHEELGKAAQRLVADPNFEKSQEALGAPMELPKAVGDIARANNMPNLGAGIDLAGEAGLGAMLLHRGENKPEAKTKPNLNPDLTALLDKKESVVPTESPIDYSALTPDQGATQGELFSRPGVIDKPWQIDENGMPYKEDITSPAQPDLFRQGPNDLAPRQPLPGTTPDMFEPTKSAPEPLTSSPGAGGPKVEVKHGNEMDYYPDNPPAFDQLTLEDHQRAKDIDQAWNDYKNTKEDTTPPKEPGPYDNGQPFEPSQGSTPMEPIVRPISNRSPMSRQRGAVDISRDTPEGPGVEEPRSGGLFARRDYLQARYNELQNTILDKSKSFAEKDAAREELRTTRLYLKETIARIAAATKERGSVGDFNREDLSKVDKMDEAKLRSLRDRYERVQDWARYNKVDGELSKRANDEANPTPEMRRKAFYSVAGGVGKKQGGAIDFGFSSLFKDKEDRENFIKAKAIVGRNDMPVEELLSRGKPTKDTGVYSGFSSGALRTKPDVAKYINTPGHASFVLGWIDDAMHLAKEAMERVLVEKVHPVRMAFQKYYGTHNIVKFMKRYDDIKRDFAIRKAFEKQPDAWFDGQNYSPTIAQMKKAGMSDASAKLWNMWDTAVENVLWPAVVEFAKDKGIHAPARIPGWIPHFTQGLWKVRLVETIVNPDGTFKKNYLATVGARTLAEAQKFQRILDQAKSAENVKAEINNPRVGNDTATLIAGMFDAQDRLQLSKGLRNLVEQIYEQASIGTLQSALERKSNPQALHQLDRMTSGDDFQLTPNEMRKAINRMTEIMEYIPTMNMRARFLTDKFFPLHMAGFLDGRELPNFKKAAIQHVGQFLRIPDTASSFIDEKMNELFLKYGYDYHGAQQFLGALNGAATAWYLFYKPSFWAVQSLQKIMTQGLMWSAKAEMQMLGVPTSSVLVGQVKSLVPARFQKTASGESVRDYAMKTGAATPYAVENLRGGILPTPIEKAIERQTRTAGVQLPYNVYKQVMPERNALQAATQITKQMNIDYSPDLGKPVWFSKEGQWMKPIFMFMQYPLHMTQMISAQVSTLARAVGEKKVAASGSALMGLAYNLGMMYAVGGLLGLPGAPQLSQTIKDINEKFGQNIPTAIRLARDIGDMMKKLNVKDEYANFVAKMSEFGLVSSVLGYDISGSARGPSIQYPDAFPHFLHLIADLGIFAVKTLTPVGVSPKEADDQAKGTPVIMKEALREFIKNNYDAGETAKSINNLVTGKTSENAPIPGNLGFPGDYKRTQIDQIMRFGGLTSVGEQTANHTYQLQQEDTKVMQKLRTTLVEKWQFNPRLLDKPENQAMLSQLAQVPFEGETIPMKQGARMSEIVRQITDYQKAREMTETERKALGLSNLRSIADWQRWQQNILQQPK